MGYWRYTPDKKDVDRVKKIMEGRADGKSQASRIKDRYKAVRRYRASLDAGSPLEAFSKRARELGADDLDFAMSGIRNESECLDAADWAGDEILTEEQSGKYMDLMLSGADGWSVLAAAVEAMSQNQRDRFAEDIVKCVLPAIRNI